MTNASLEWLGVVKITSAEIKTKTVGGSITCNHPKRITCNHYMILVGSWESNGWNPEIKQGIGFHSQFFAQPNWVPGNTAHLSSKWNTSVFKDKILTSINSLGVIFNGSVSQLHHELGFFTRKHAHAPPKTDMKNNGLKMCRLLRMVIFHCQAIACWFSGGYSLPKSS